MRNAFLYLICFSALLPTFAIFPVQARGDEPECYTALPIDSNLEVISIENATQITQLAQLGNGDLTDFVVTPGGETLVVVTPTHAQIYGLSDTSTEMLFLADCRPLNQVAISFDGSLIAISERDTSSIQLWDSSSNSLMSTINATGDQITSLAFDPTGTFLAWASSEIAGDSWIGNGRVFLYDLRAESQIATFENVADIVTELHFSPDGEQIVLRGSYPGYGFDMQVWGIETKERYTIRESWLVVPAYSSNTAEVALAVTMSLDITNEYSHQIEIWNPQTDTVIQSISIPGNTQRDPFAIPNRIPALALSSDAAIVATGNDEGEITIWDVSTGTQLSSFQAYSQSVVQLAFTNDDGKLISLGSDETDQSIRVWGIES
jgi:WD40 repeat protein